MILFGVCGKAGAGKDTVGLRLSGKHSFATYALADPIKDMLAIMGVDARNRNTREAPHPVFGKSPREMAQTLGTEWGRDRVNANCWLLLAKEFFKTRESCFDGVVVTDIRFDNEAEWIRDHGVLIHVVRPGVAEIAAHVSEDGIEFDPTRNDVLVDNSKDRDFLNEQVDMIINAIKNSKRRRDYSGDTNRLPDSCLRPDDSLSLI